MQKRFYVEIVGIWSTYLWLLFSSGAFLTSGLYGGRMQMSFCCTQRVKLTRSFSALKRASKGSVVGLSGRHSHKLSHIDLIAVFCHKGESLSIFSLLRSIHSYRERVLSALYVTLKYIFMWITKAGTLHLQAGDWKKQHSTSNSPSFFFFTERFAKDKLRSVTVKIPSLPLAISKLLVCPVLMEKNTPAKWFTLELGNHSIKKGQIASLIKPNRQAPLSAGLTAETFISNSLQHACMPLWAALPSGFEFCCILQILYSP